MIPSKAWPRRASRSNRSVQAMYEAGFVGAALPPPWVIEELHDAIVDGGGQVDATDACHSFGLAESFKGQLVTPYVHAEKIYPGCMPGPGQDVGDCVSHGTKNACLVTMTCEVAAAKPDEVTGKVEEAPEVSPEGIKNGVLSTEAIYWWRRHSGHGWFCPDAAKVVMKESGAWLRQDYPELGINLTKYSGGLASKYGRTPPSGAIAEAGKAHLIRTTTECSTFEEIRDLLGNGYGISSCGSEGFASTRDENGVARRQGSWAHAMAYIGADDRPEIHAKYGGPLVLVLNSWGSGWISGPRTILGTSQEIPEGSFWARYADLKRRYAGAFSGHNGWPRQQLPDYDPGFPTVAA